METNGKGCVFHHSVCCFQKRPDKIRYHLCSLRSSPPVCGDASVFCRSIESLLTLNFDGLSLKNGNSLNDIVKVCSTAAGAQRTDLNPSPTPTPRLSGRNHKYRISRPTSRPGAFTLAPPGTALYLPPLRKTNGSSRPFYSLCNDAAECRAAAVD